ncbi:hypothetical protein niasHT_028276 [Heterodera trifolii]|uniref:Uncharacterized protein n=1 Tax=Heterodera trifolii TaxID=157864 RepID=A0ABD2JU65_9BILA
MIKAMISVRHFVSLLLVILALSIESVNGGNNTSNPSSSNYSNKFPARFGITNEQLEQMKSASYTSQQPFYSGQSMPAAGPSAGNAFTSSTNLAGPSSSSNKTGGFSNFEEFGSYFD